MGPEIDAGITLSPDRRNNSLKLLISILILLSAWPYHLLLAEPTPVASISPHSGRVEFSDTYIIELHDTVGSFSPRDRAQAVERRIEGLATSRLFDPAQISATDHESSTDLVAGDTTLLTITEGDAAALRLPRATLADASVAAIRSAIAKDRQSKSPHQMLLAGLYAALSTLTMLLLLFGLARLFPRAIHAVIAARGKKIKGIRIRSLELMTPERITDFSVSALKLLRAVLTIVLLYFYIPLVLSFFPWTANLAPKLFGFVLNPLRQIAHVFINYIPSLFFLLVAAVVTRYVLRFIQIFFGEIGKGTLSFDGFYREWAEPTYKLVRFLVLAFALVVMFPYLPGSGSPAFQGVTVFLGILLSLGSSSAISNVVAGVVLTYMRPFKLGDRVRIADTVGDVEEKTLLITRIKTIKNADITIPNAMVLGSHIINYSSSASSSGLILHTTVTIGYDVPWRTVHRLLMGAAQGTENIQADPPPFVLQTSLDDFFVSYEINAYTRVPNRMAVTYSELHQRIHDAFDEAGVEITSPHYTAIRDGNDSTVPSDHRSQAEISRAFKVRTRSES